jgi:chorismate synthase
MSGSTFGNIFKVHTFGESHGGCIGAVIDGCPAGLELSESDIQPDLDRRKPGQSSITTPRAEEDKITILSGVFMGKTTGSPILLLAHNKDKKPEDYLEMKNYYRPGHADYTFDAKYGFRDWAGSGRASARETLARVAAGAIAKKFLKEKLNIEFLSYVEQVGDIITSVDYSDVTIGDIEANIVRCPDQDVAKQMIQLIESIKSEGDSIGGVIKAIIKNVPAGLGEPVFDKLPAELAKAMMSINATKGFEYGSGFAGVSLKGSQHNDIFYLDNDKIKTKTNHAGGTLGGISNGADIYFRVAFKPVSTISKPQPTVTIDNKEAELSSAGRHDPCVLPRAVPIVDAMAALVIMDLYLRHRAKTFS